MDLLVQLGLDAAPREESLNARNESDVVSSIVRPHSCRHATIVVDEHAERDHD